VLVLEAAGLVGGTTAKSGGVMWIPNNPVMQAAGIRDERPDALRYLARTAYPVQFDPSSPTLGLPPSAFQLLEAFYDHGAEAVTALADAGAFELTAVAERALPLRHSRAGGTRHQGWTHDRPRRPGDHR